MHGQGECIAGTGEGETDGAGKGALVADERDLIVVNERLDIGESVKNDELVLCANYFV